MLIAPLYINVTRFYKDSGIEWLSRRIFEDTMNVAVDYNASVCKYSLICLCYLTKSVTTSLQLSLEHWLLWFNIVKIFFFISLLYSPLDHKNKSSYLIIFSLISFLSYCNLTLGVTAVRHLLIKKIWSQKIVLISGKNTYTTELYKSLSFSFFF